MMMILLLPSSFLLLLFILFSVASKKKQVNERKHPPPPPPGPPGFPIIGNLHLLGNLPHRTLNALSKKHGTVMSLRLGQIKTIVVTSSEAAEQFLKTHDVVFANRPRLEATYYFTYGYKGLVFTQYGEYWRKVRKVCTMQLLSAAKVDSFAPLRKRELKIAIKSLQKAAALGDVVDLTKWVQNLVGDVLYKMVFGCSKVDDSEFDLRELLKDGNNLSGVFNLSDFVPFLRPFDLQGLKQRFKKNSEAVDQVLEKIIKEHEQGFQSHAENNRAQHKDFIDILLSLMNQPVDLYNEQNHVVDRTNIKAILVDMIGASFETTSTTVEWALSELLRNPRVMKKLQNEFHDVVGVNKLVEENDLGKLSYLDFVIMETLRLYPAAALVPRESMEDATVGGYFIEKKSRVIINLWAIGRDLNIWSDNAEEFYPERFHDKNLDYWGKKFEFIPFGFGRRRCPGIHLGLATVKLVVAQVVHCFCWELPSNMAPSDLDMSETFGISLPRAKPLLAVPTYRLSVNLTDESH